MRAMPILTALVLLSACAEGGENPLAGMLAGAGAPALMAADPAAAPLIEPGAALAFGDVGTLCDLRDAARGTEVDSRAGYTLWDSQPGATTPRSHFVTGIDGGCAVQFTAALAMFGDLAMHETMRYQAASASRPYSAADNAYEVLKATFCGAPAGQPCGLRIEELGRDTTFITAYETFGGDDWAEILLHRGQVLAAGDR